MSRQTETYGQRASVQPGASDSLSPRLGSIWCREVRRAGRAAGRERQHRRLALYCPASPAAAATGGTGTAAAEPDSDAEYLERKKKKKKKASPKKKEDGQQAQAESNKRAEKDTGVAGGRAPHGPPRVEAASLAGAPPRPALNEQTAARPVGSTRDPAPCTVSRRTGPLVATQSAPLRPAAGGAQRRRPEWCQGRRRRPASAPYRAQRPQSGRRQLPRIQLRRR